MSHSAKIVLLQNFWDVKNEVFEKKIAFFCFLSFLCWRNRNRKKKNKQNGKGKKHPIKIGFLRWSSKNVKNQKNRKGETKRIFVHTICLAKSFLDQNSVNQEKL